MLLRYPRMQLHEIMRRGPFTIDESDTLGHAQQAMRRAPCQHLPVMGHGKLVGMLSEHDVLVARARSAGDDDWWRILVRAAMRSPVQTAGPEDTVRDAARRMASLELGALPVVDTGTLLGLVTMSDVLAAEIRIAEAPDASSRLTAADAMTPYPFAVHPEALLVDAITVMIDQHIRHLPVVSGTSVVVGMISDRDVRTAVGDPSTFVQLQRGEEQGLRVHHVMRKVPKVVTFDCPLKEVAHHFADEHVGAVAVVDKFAALLGVVSYLDVLRVFSR